MNPELLAPPPPLPESTIPSGQDAVSGEEEEDELDYGEVSQPDPDAQRREELRKRALELQSEDARSKVRNFLVVHLPALQSRACRD